MRLGVCAAAGIAVLISGATVPMECSGALVGPGDIAFVGFNADGGDDFAIVLLASAAPGTVVWFTDNGWTGAAFTAIETSFSWTVGPAGLPAGSIVTFNNIGSSPSVSSGTFTGTTMALDSAGDAIFAFLGANATSPSAFLAAISNTANQFNGLLGTLSGTGLALNSTAVLLPGGDPDGGAYNGSRTGLSSFSDYLSLIGNTANWTIEPSLGTNVLPFSTTPFQVQSTSVPEPAGVPIVLFALSTGAMVWRFKF